jgi:ABC-type enterochelin transport system ATPase subunit
MVASQTPLYELFGRQPYNNGRPPTHARRHIIFQVNYSSLPTIASRALRGAATWVC